VAFPLSVPYWQVNTGTYFSKNTGTVPAPGAGTVSVLSKETCLYIFSVALFKTVFVSVQIVFYPVLLQCEYLSPWNIQLKFLFSKYRFIRRLPNPNQSLLCLDPGIRLLELCAHCTAIMWKLSGVTAMWNSASCTAIKWKKIIYISGWMAVWRCTAPTVRRRRTAAAPAR
jgi:hypothetical protein